MGAPASRLVVERGGKWMKIFRTVIFLSWLVVVLSAAACGTQGARQGAENGSERTQAEQPLTGSAQDFERAQFDDPTHIDNKWDPPSSWMRSVAKSIALCSPSPT